MTTSDNSTAPAAMTLSGIAVGTPGAIGFDSDTVIAPAIALQLRSAGFAFAIRYLSRTMPQNTGDLSAGEVQVILDAGLALMAVQHVQKAGWTPSARRGTAYGGAAVANAVECGLLPGIALWLDLEGVGPWVTAAQTIAYCNAWHDQVVGGGFVSGIYVGANQPLSAEQLYRELLVEHYWKSASTVPEIAERGYQMVQSLMPNPVSGFGLDRDVVMGDAMGGLPIWMAPARGAESGSAAPAVKRRTER
jgi:hypothetical protein